MLKEREGTPVESRREWELVYARERATLMVELEDLVDEIHHVGSTAVPHLAARPVLDILVVVSESEKLGRCIDELERLGYERLKGEVLFVARKWSKPPCRIALVAKGHPVREEMLLFRDLLRTDPRLRCRYEALKMDMLRRCPFDPQLCRQMKIEFVRSAIRCGKERMNERPQSRL